MAESKFMKKLTELQNHAKLNSIEASESLPDFKKAYEMGIRARNDETGIYFRKSNGTKTYVYHENGWANWALLSDYESKTWKERHAKGVPVKMTEQEADKCMLAAKDGVYYVRMYSGEPEVHVFDSTDKDPSNAIPTVRFCNFRYKQSWLDKKGGERA